MKVEGSTAGFNHIRDLMTLCCLATGQCHLCPALLHCPPPVSHQLQVLLVSWPGCQNYLDLLTAHRNSGLWNIAPTSLFEEKSLISTLFHLFHWLLLEKMQMFPIWPVPPYIHWQMLGNISAYFQPLIRCTDECHVCSSVVFDVFLSCSIVASTAIHNFGCCAVAIEWFPSLFIFHFCLEQLEERSFYQDQQEQINSVPSIQERNRRDSKTHSNLRWPNLSQ